MEGTLVGGPGAAVTADLERDVVLGGAGLRDRVSGDESGRREEGEDDGGGELHFE